MVGGPAGGSKRRFSWRIGRLVGGLAVVIAVMAGFAAFAWAQITPPTTTPPPARNPDLREGCGLKIMLVLDESESVFSTPNQIGVTQTRDAANAFVRALVNTGSQLATSAFSFRGLPGLNYQQVTSTSQNTFEQWIDGTAGPNPFNPTAANLATNWQDAFGQVLRTGGSPDLVVFVTDGVPNTINTGAGAFPNNNATVSTNAGGAFSAGALDSAVSAANDVKNDLGARIFAIGVGPDVQGEVNAGRLAAVSGTTEFTGINGQHNFRQSDLTVVGFAELESAMREIVDEMCGGTLTVSKFLPGVPTQTHPGDAWNPASGWTFRTTLSGGGHTWVTPHFATDPGRPTAELATGHSAELGPGIAQFEWHLNPGVDHVTAMVNRVEKDGFTFVRSQCDKDGVPVDEPNPLDIGTFTLGENDFVTCRVYNRPNMATVTVEKSLDPSEDPGEFHLHIGSVQTGPVGDGGRLAQTFPVDEPSQREVSVGESPAAGTDLTHYETSITCEDIPSRHPVAHTSTAAELTVPLTGQDGQNVFCTITNRSNRFGEITVIKHLIPTDDPGRFHLHITPSSHVSPPVGDGGRLGPIGPLPFGEYHVTETPANGTNLGHYNISTTCINERSGRPVAHNAHGADVSFALDEAANNIQCTITNHRPGVRTGHLEVVKHLVPHDDAGTFNLLVGGKAFAVDVGHNGTTGPLEFALGRHTVTEHGAEGTGLAQFSISTTCVNRAGHTLAHNAHGPSVSVDLVEGANIVCTITNKRIGAPPGGGENIPPPPGPNPHLSVVKTMPAHAQVGALVPISVTVHNLGHGTAHGVQLHENRPAGLQIVHVGNHGTIQHGTAVWHLGNLAPGKSRTVHATARVQHPGLHVDTAVATALNADPALSDAAVRAARRPRRPAPPPPRVTG